MSLNTSIGIIVRALPISTGLEIKLLRKEDGAVTLIVPATRQDIIDTARSARMTGEEMLVRHTDSGLAVAVQSPSQPMAA